MATKHTEKDFNLLTAHDLRIVKDAVKNEMGGGYRQVYQWAGEGFKEHWAASIALNVVTAREGSVTTDWVFQVKMAVYRELGLSTEDVAAPVKGL